MRALPLEGDGAGEGVGVGAGAGAEPQVFTTEEALHSGGWHQQR